MSEVISNSKLKKILISKENNKFYFKFNKKYISPWNDIPYLNLKKKCYNMVCEIPKWTRKKFELDTKLKNNPIIQDKINGKPREFIYGAMMWNYGFIPQTYEDPNHIYSLTGKKGDGDPIDIIDIGSKQYKIGDIIPVKVIGVIPMIDDDETDWKIVAISLSDPLADKLNTINQINKVLPGFFDAVFDWFRNYKFQRKGIRNKFSLGGKPGDKRLAEKIIKQGNLHWNTKIN